METCELIREELRPDKGSRYALIDHGQTIASVYFDPRRIGVKNDGCILRKWYVEDKERYNEACKTLLLHCVDSATDMGLSRLYIALPPDSPSLDRFFEWGAVISRELDTDEYLQSPEFLHLDIPISSRVRPLKEEDLPAFLELARETEELFGADTGSREFQDAMYQAVSQEQAFGIDTEDEKVAGAIVLDQRAGEIAWLAVRKALHGRGLGQSLLNTAVEQMQEHERILVQTFADGEAGGAAARALYQKNGFGFCRAGGKNPAGVETVILSRAAITVRRAEISDSRAIAELIVRAWQNAYFGIVDPEFVRQLRPDGLEQVMERNISEKLETIFVYQEAGVLRGFASGKRVEGDADCELVGLYVDPYSQGQKIGSQVFQSICDYFASLGCRRLSAKSLKGARNNSFYTKHGGEKRRAEDLKLGGKKYPSVEFFFHL